jgi:hypothetical protein
LSTGSIIKPNEVLLANKGFLKLDDNVEIAELKDLEIKMTAETKEIALMNSATKGEINTSYKGTVTFEIYKLYSRFKPAILAGAQSLTPFTFKIEATVYTPDTKNEESIVIDSCWIKGDITLFALKAENDFLTEKYEAGFRIEDVSFQDTIDDGETWASLT